MPESTDWLKPDYSHKELAKILRLLTYNLIAQAKMEEAQRNLAQAHDQLDQIMAETQSQRETADGKDAELQAEVKGLQQALTDLRAESSRKRTLVRNSNKPRLF
ncbi:hypothetical protein HF521_016842 [Silurus meridionalis]|uniref:Uncharacterized protein n=1 Tax=Silurus meridionalis TaxID=175797 RepID=A0A8T0BRQ1_SILME|nr:hypothetical protein HF521_016842 [Silurus meridionalis]